ncbi:MULTISPECIES: hypothetical protein [Actinomadura]|uniref:Uncharacterized protein n=1 Tax=Actinomadura madurae TaxID=1993 RepID=A0A1I5VED3_9ACTN|nr:hypothetical protein [Actinomadura madurae]SFQ05707.1 hypothetical protein SAMN04489713_12193 [Actinomadura madurae]SPT60575.1 Uncharacterised protein [Actinomadura madurae]
MRKLSTALGGAVLSGALVFGAAPAQAAPEPDARQIPQDVIERLPAPLRAAAESPGSIGWDDKGPYIVWGNMACRIHLFVPEEWGWAWGTGPCWF